MLRTPVAFIIFNRPETTAKVFNEIARARPTKLLVIADGPRADRPGEQARCAQARAVIDGVDWDCEVLTNFSDVNLGCKKRVASGIDWVFEQVPEAIILEDDCLPHPSFFTFCEELLEYYRHDERVAMISGDNFQFGQRRPEASYYFSRFSHIWGWASWRRAWKHYDRDIRGWPRFKAQRWLAALFPSRIERAHWESIFDQVYAGAIDTWDYQWTLAAWQRGMVSVMPAVNLVSNLGFGPGATHTLDQSRYSNMAVESMQWPLTHPSVCLPWHEADAYTARTMFNASPVRHAWQTLRSRVNPTSWIRA